MRCSLGHGDTGSDTCIGNILLSHHLSRCSWLASQSYFSGTHGFNDVLASLFRAFFGVGFILISRIGPVFFLVGVRDPITVRVISGDHWIEKPKVNPPEQLDPSFIQHHFAHRAAGPVWL